MISLSFLGAAGTVTGSKTLLTVNDKKVLVDCGIFQGRRQLRQRNWIAPNLNVRELSAVILTHAHIDHCGYLPRLMQQGFTGRIYATPPTIALAQILLLDTAQLQEEDAAYRNKKNATRYEKALPLFTVEDARRVFNNFTPVSFREWHKLDDEMKFRFHLAGHILGAASVELKLNDGNSPRTILFSGDVGRYAVPLVCDPEKPSATDYLVCESTYGGEIHPPVDIFYEMANLLDRVIKNKTVLLIPAFAVGRTQQITYIIDVLIRQKRIPPIEVHIDSPMAVRITDIYRRFPGFHSIDRQLLKKEKNVFYGKNVTLHRKRKSSKLLNKLRGPAVIISASGMMTGGRILHHLLNRLPNEDNLIALVGYMAAETLGRKLADGEKLVYIHKTPVPVRAEVINFGGLSGHADSYELLHWLEDFEGTPQKVFVNHGEPERAAAFARQLSEQRQWNAYCPSLDETISL